MTGALRTAVALLTVIVISSGAATAEIVTIHPTCDTYVDERTGLGYPDAAELLLGDTQFNLTTTAARAFFKFDLASALPTDAVILSADMRVNCEDGNAFSSAVGAYYIVDDSWECDITWFTAPHADTNLMDVTSVTNEGWYDWVVDAGVGHALNDDQVFSVMLRHQSEQVGQAGTAWSSTETAEPELPMPYLWVKYEIRDFGDAPDPPYNTLLANNAAWHSIGSGLHLGDTVDAELDGHPDALAEGDDEDGIDDEDGVVFTSWIVVGREATVEVTLSATGYLSGWIDFDDDGIWNQTTERIIDPTLLAAGTHQITYQVPLHSHYIEPNVGTYARFRVSDGPVLLPYGGSGDGEVEDYFVDIKPIGTKWTQPPNAGEDGPVAVSTSYPHTLAEDFLCIETGAIVEIDLWCCGAMGAEPAPDTLTLFMHADSMPPGEPGEVLWSRNLGPDDYYVTEHMSGVGPDALWLVPGGASVPLSNTASIYRLVARINPADAFIQEGSYYTPVTYWLGVRSSTEFGWFDSQYILPDGSRYAMGPVPALPPWYDLLYPPEHAHRAGSRMSMAFQLTNAPSTAVESDPDGGVDSPVLHPSTPNPFNPRTTLRYEVPSGGAQVRLEIINAAGRVLRTLVDAEQVEGPYSITWRGLDDDGREVSSGVYFCRLTADGLTQSIKMVLLR